MRDASRPVRMLRGFAILIALGLYLTLRGYHSRDGDQAYRLPILLHQQTPSLYANDPFVRAFDGFNPHRGYLALLDLASRPLGLSVALAALFAATFALNVAGVDRLARLCWPEGRGSVGVWCVVLVLMAKAGNLGTNHLFEAMLLDRLIALGFGWIAIGELICDRPRIPVAAAWLGCATLIHPSMGLQLGIWMSASLLVWSLFEPGPVPSLRLAIIAILAIVAGQLPGIGLMLAQRRQLTDGLAPDEFYTLSALIQSPQHMVPHLWRLNQWIAAACYPILAIVTALPHLPHASMARRRLVMATGVGLLGLLAAWIGIEVVGSLSITVFQPFRMATVVRGLCLILASNHLCTLWARGGAWDRCRAMVIVFGLSGDLAWIVATTVELTSLAAERVARGMGRVAGPLVLGLGLVYLSRHDTESGAIPLMLGVGMALGSVILKRFAAGFSWNRRRVVALVVLSWLVPVLALLPHGVLPAKLSARLVEHCRFGESPVDDLERLALWCRVHTPAQARFVTPPGPKTFRLWSHREVAFNRAAGPYHAEGLADWARRYQDHVGFRGTLSEFAREYLKDRQALDRRFDLLSDEEKASLLRSQEADFLLAASPKPDESGDSQSLEAIHVEGRYAIYRLRSPRDDEPARMAKGRSDRNRLTEESR